MDTKDTSKKKKYRYYIVEFSHPINKDEKFIYVPESWVIDKVDGSTTIIRYPSGVTEAVLEKMKSDVRDLKDNAFDGWATMVVNLKHKTDNKEFAKNYTKKFNKRGDMLFQNTNSGKPSYDTLSFEETSSKPKPVKSSQTGKNNEHETFKATSGFNTKALLNKAKSKHLSLADAAREKIIKLNADETASCTEIPTKYNATRSYSHFSSDLKKNPTSSDKCHSKNDLLMDTSQDISEDDYEKSVKFKNIYSSNHLRTYHYTPQFTNTPLKMKLLKKPAKPTNTSLKERRSVKKVRPSVEKIATTKNSTAENSSQELTKHLTKDILKPDRFQITKDKQKLSITKESSSVDILGNAESKYYEKNKPNEKEEQSKITNKAYLDSAYTKELNELRLRLNNISDVVKVFSEMKEIIKKLDYFNNQYSDEPVFTSSQGPTPMELEEKDGVVIKPARDSEKSQTAANEIVHEKGAQQFSKPKSNITSQFILPKDYYENDSKWTLRYRKKAEGLVELEEGSGVYVNGKILVDCKSVSKDSSEFARKLLLEVFSDGALTSCCLYGSKKMPKKLRLDSHATRVLFTAVENHARERDWEIDIPKIKQSIRNKLISMRKSHESRKHYKRQKRRFSNGLHKYGHHIPF